MDRIIGLRKDGPYSNYQKQRPSFILLSMHARLNSTCIHAAWKMSVDDHFGGTCRLTVLSSVMLNLSCASAIFEDPLDLGFCGKASITEVNHKVENDVKVFAYLGGRVVTNVYKLLIDSMRWCWYSSAGQAIKSTP
jgi:hypothetical protein